MIIGFDKVTLEELLKDPIEGGEVTITVPPFQRKYVWGKEEEVLRLLEDFFSNLNSNYFFGPIVLKDNGNNKVEIVDGQQRITTFTLLIRALIDLLLLKKDKNEYQKHNNDHIDKFIYNYKDLILTTDVLYSKPRFHISKIIDKKYIKEIISNDNTSKYELFSESKKSEHPAYKNIQKAYIKIFEYIRDYFEKYDSEDDFIHKMNDVQYSLKKLQIFLLITVKNYVDAFTVFESINARSKALGIGDLVKNLSFKNLYAAHADDNDNWLDQLEEIWDDLEAILNNNLGDFIFHMWISKNAPCPKNKVYFKLEQYLDNLSPNENAQFILYDLSDEAKAYQYYQDPEKIKVEDKYTEGLRVNYSNLKSLGAKRCYPILLSLDYCIRQKFIKKEEHLNFLEKLVALTFWYSGICENDAKRLEKEYLEIATNLREKDNAKAINSYADKLNIYFPEHDISFVNFLSNKFNNSSVINMMLRSFEKYLTPDSELEIGSSSKIHIEHILPLNPDKSSEWFSLFPKDSHSANKNKIGNLTLLTGKKNIAVSNYEFRKKKYVYEKSPLAINKDISKCKNWTPNTINNRSNLFFEYANKIWKNPKITSK